MKPASTWQRRSNKERWIILIFTAAFLLIGVSGVAMLGVKPLYDYWRTRDEVTVAARITRLDCQPGRRGRKVVEYTYLAAGQTHTGTHWSLFSAKEHLVGRLQKAKTSDTPIQVFIDPADPGFSVIEREFSWMPWAIAPPFFGVFALTGCFLIYQIRKELRGGPRGR